jgi:hypothetical protein
MMLKLHKDILRLVISDYITKVDRVNLLLACKIFYQVISSINLNVARYQSLDYVASSIVYGYSELLEKMRTDNQKPVVKWMQNLKGKTIWLNCKSLDEHSTIMYYYNDWPTVLAVENNRLNVMKWLFNNSYKGIIIGTYYEDTCCSYGYLEVLQWLCTLRSFTPNIWTYSNAALGGHLHILKWLRITYRWPPIADGHLLTFYAAKKGHLETLKWLIDNGIPINKRKILQCANIVPEIRKFVLKL